MSISAKKSVKTAHQENLPKNIDQENQRKTPRKYQYTVHEENLPNQPLRKSAKTTRLGYLTKKSTRQSANTTSLGYVTKTSTKKIRQPLLTRKQPNTQRKTNIPTRNLPKKSTIHHNRTFTVKCQLDIFSHYQPKSSIET